MEYSKIIDEMQSSILNLQEQLNKLKMMVPSSYKDVYLTKQEAADFIGKSVRQLDRDCERFGIPKLFMFGGVRIRKEDLLIGMGLLSNCEVNPGESEFDRIFRKHWGRAPK